MRNNSLAIRYGQALFDVGVENQLTKDFYDQMIILEQTLAENADFGRFLVSASIGISDKQNLISNVFSKSFHPYLINFLNLILDKNRESILGEIILSYKELYQSSKGIIVAKLETAKPLDDKLEAEISELLKKKYTNKKIVFDHKIDPTLLGGARVSVDDYVIDGTLKTRLSNLRKDIVKL